MKSLFFDTTNELQLGLLDKEFNWVALENHPQKKASQAIHGLIIELLEKHECALKDLLYIFKISGPGSYTGMRVSTGIGQILEWNNFETLSFYHYDIAKVHTDSGIWAAKAFKDEFYFYEWSQDDEKSFVLSKDESIKFLEKSSLNLYSNQRLIEGLDFNFISTSELLKNEPKSVFSEVVSQKMKKELFYFRPLNEEFKRKEEK